MKQKITWLGHGSWLMETVRGTKIYVDPWINDNPACPYSLDDIKEADIVCVTHGHNDHLGDAIELVKKTGATLVTLPDIAAYCSKYGIPYDQNGGAVHTGGSVVVKDVRIHAVFALHYSDIWGEENKKDSSVLMPGSGCCGFVIIPNEGRSVYFAGDTGVFGDMKLISRLYKPYISVITIGDKYTMGIREASVAAEFLNSKYIIPGHYNTFPSNMADTDEFIKLVSQTAPATEVVILNSGGSFEVE